MDQKSAQVGKFLTLTSQFHSAGLEGSAIPAVPNSDRRRHDACTAHVAGISRRRVSARACHLGL
jgi:hypothetical protein